MQYTQYVPRYREADWLKRCVHPVLVLHAVLQYSNTAGREVQMPSVQTGGMLQAEGIWHVMHTCKWNDAWIHRASNLSQPVCSVLHACFIPSKYP